METEPVKRVPQNIEKHPEIPPIVAAYQTENLETYTEVGYFERLSYPQMTFDLVVPNEVEERGQQDMDLWIAQKCKETIRETPNTNGYVSCQLLTFIDSGTGETIVTLSALLEPLDDDVDPDEINNSIKNGLKDKLKAKPLVRQDPKEKVPGLLTFAVTITVITLGSGSYKSTGIFALIKTTPISMVWSYLLNSARLSAS